MLDNELFGGSTFTSLKYGRIVVRLKKPSLINKI
jgi:hypothetical protein